MKKIVIIFFFLVNALMADVHWVKELDDAYDIAAKEHKIVFVILSQKGCPACKYMKNVVLKNDNVVKEMRKNFVAVHLDIHEDFVPLALEHFVTPTLFFLNSDEKILYKVNGYKNAKEFLADIKRVAKTNL